MNIDSRKKVEKTTITAASFSAKYKSKREIFNLLTVEAKAYLSSPENFTIYFLKDLISGNKKFIKCGHVQVLFVPQYESLSIESILEEFLKYDDVANHLPEERDFNKLPRQWIINVISTVVGQPFNDWVRRRIEERNKKVAEGNNLLIQLDPDIARAFHESTAISLSKGTSAHLLKAGIKRRRTRDQLQQDKNDPMINSHEMSIRNNEIEELRKQLEEAREEASNNLAAAEILTEMINKGEAKLDGNGKVTIIKEDQQQLQDSPFPEQSQNQFNIQL